MRGSRGRAYVIGGEILYSVSCYSLLVPICAKETRQKRLKGYFFAFLGSELGSELTSLAGSEFGSELASLAGSELGLASYSEFSSIFQRVKSIELRVLSYDESKSKKVFERAFMTLFGQDNETFTRTMFLYVAQLQNQFDKDEFQEDKSMAVFWVLNNQFQKFIDWQETLLLHMDNVKKSVAERTCHKRQYVRRMKERQMRSKESQVVSSKSLDASLVVAECGGTKSDEHITGSSLRTYITHVVDADIKPVNNQVLSAE
nr:hypothetical protein [Tanacetum cinerariifolium]